MTRKTWTLMFIIAIAACLTLVLVPVSASAQGIGGTVKHGVEKGAGTVQKGAEGAYDATKKGVEATGRGVKKAVTGEDTDHERVTQGTTGTTGTTGTPATSSTRTRTRASAHNRARTGGEKNLPGTAGELPLLALLGASCLAAVGTRRLVLRKQS